MRLSRFNPFQPCTCRTRVELERQSCSPRSPLLFSSYAIVPVCHGFLERLCNFSRSFLSSGTVFPEQKDLISSFTSLPCAMHWCATSTPHQPRSQEATQPSCPRLALRKFCWRKLFHWEISPLARRALSNPLIVWRNEGFSGRLTGISCRFFSRCCRSTTGQFIDIELTLYLHSLAAFIEYTRQALEMKSCSPVPVASTSEMQNFKDWRRICAWIQMDPSSMLRCSCFSFPISS